MPMKSIGLVTVSLAGTPVQLKSTSQICDSVNIEPVKSLGPYVDNVGKIYIGTSAAMNKTTGAGVLYVLAPGQPAATVRQPGRIPFLDDVSNYWMDADTSGDGALISYV